MYKNEVGLQAKYTESNSLCIKNKKQGKTSIKMGRRELGEVRMCKGKRKKESGWSMSKSEMNGT